MLGRTMPTQGFVFFEDWPRLSLFLASLIDMLNYLLNIVYMCTISISSFASNFD
jgi:hypothetical protein